MKAPLKRFSACLLWVIAHPAQADEAAYVLPEITVSPERRSGLPGDTSVNLRNLRGAALQDAAAWLAASPGAAVVRNGPQTGIVQLRGLANERVKIRVDGMEITPACPNHMDPPLHYAPVAQLGRLEVLPGIIPVSMGGDSLAGTVNAETPPPVFSTDGIKPLARLSGTAQSVNGGTNLDASLGLAGQTASLAYSGERVRGANYRYPGGEMGDTGFRTARQLLKLGLRPGDGILTLQAGRQDSRAGTPALSMDMVEDSAEHALAAYTWQVGEIKMDARIYGHSVNHLMDNYSLRPIANPMMRMQAPASSRDLGGQLGARLPLAGGEAHVGMDTVLSEENASQRRISDGATMDVLNHVRRNRWGLYGEWLGSAGAWQPLLGLRADRVSSDAQAIGAIFPGSPALAVDRAAFNQTDRSKQDTLFDWTAALARQIAPGTRVQFGLARKSRAPSLIERYLWTPLAASAGQADNRTYLGNPKLHPEVSHQASVGLSWRSGPWEFSPVLFYSRVTDFIQGLPINRLDNAGKPVLQYQNLAARLYGADLQWHYKPGPQWTVYGSLSYVRGRNPDTGDNLYRIAPPHGRVAADWRQGRWLLTAEWAAALRNNHVAAYNGEQPTPGWGIVNLHTQWQPHPDLTLRAGVENLLDKPYYDALGGINRVAGSDVAVGAPLPQPGRNLYARLEWLW